jgi:hypothetical protein
LIKSSLELVIGETIRVRIERSGDALTVEVAGARSLVALGDSLSLPGASLRFVRDEEPTGYQLVAMDGEGFELAAHELCGRVGRARHVTICDLVRGDRVTLGDGSVLEVPSD